MIAEGLARAFPEANERTGATVIELRDEVSRQSRLMLLALAGASMCVLLIACANLASLLLARAVQRQRELAVRVAMGARPRRIARQVLTESLVLSAGGRTGRRRTGVAGGPAHRRAGADVAADCRGARPPICGCWRSPRWPRWPPGSASAWCRRWRIGRGSRGADLRQGTPRVRQPGDRAPAIGVRRSPRWRRRWCCWSRSVCSCGRCGGCRTSIPASAPRACSRPAPLCPRRSTTPSPPASSSSPRCCRTCAPCPACRAPPTPASCRW